MKTCKEMAEKWNVSERTVTTFCKSGKIPGAVKTGRSWKIPNDAQKPADGRISSSRYRKKEIAKYEKEYFVRIVDGSATEVDLTSALENLSKMLTEHYGKAPVIIIDEYDTPIQEGYAKDLIIWQSIP